MLTIIIIKLIIIIKKIINHIYKKIPNNNKGCKKKILFY